VLQCFDHDLGDVARLAEGANLDAISVADHPGSTWSPFVALATAVPATSRLGLGTAVINCGVRQPLDIASDAATLQAASGGRVVLGLGAGHAPREWSQVGQHRPSPTRRIDRFEEVVRSVVALLAGEAVTLDGAHVTLHDARLGMDLPSPPALLVGGGNRRLVRLGCEVADVVELAGIGRTLPDGRYHEPRWSVAQVDEAVAAFEACCAAAGRRPALGALVQHIETTDDAEAVARRYRDTVAAVVPAELLPSVADMLECPYILIGTVAELVAKLHRLRERWGFTRVTVRSIEATAEVIAALAQAIPLGSTSVAAGAADSS
jgi:probable F420-dependent oxidoreductase